MMKKELKLSSKKMQKEKKLKRNLRIALIIIFFILLLLYFVVGIIYNNGNFSISLDRNLYFDKGLIIYDDPSYKVYRTELLAEAPKTFDDISYKWLPNDISEHAGGSHNGDNYLAYTFYIENQGEETADYWSEVVIEDVIKNVDDAVRVRIYKNDEYVTYAKMGSDGVPEPNTVAFQEENLVVREHTENFKPGDIDKYTIVLWIEGADPECTDNILGGEFKVSMQFNSEYVED